MSTGPEWWWTSFRRDVKLNKHKVLFRSNISKTSASTSTGYPDTEKEMKSFVLLLLGAGTLRWSTSFWYGFLLLKNDKRILPVWTVSHVTFLLRLCQYQWCFCQRVNRAKKRGFLGGRFIMPRNVGKKFCVTLYNLNFWPYLGVRSHIWATV